MTFLVVASAGSSSVSVIGMSVRTAVLCKSRTMSIDTLDTRFQGVQALATCEVGDRVFVFAGGGDDGLTMMTLMPDGRLVMCGQQLQLPGLALHNISAMTAHLVNGKIELFVAGEDTGITRLQVDPGSLSSVTNGGPNAATLTGNSGGDMILGGEGAERIVGDSGADILGDGGGADTMFGGAGADTFVLAADGANDVIGRLPDRHRPDRPVGLGSDPFACRVDDHRDIEMAPLSPGEANGCRSSRQTGCLSCPAASG